MELGGEVGYIGDALLSRGFIEQPATSSKSIGLRKFSNSSKTWATSISFSWGGSSWWVSHIFRKLLGLVHSNGCSGESIEFWDLSNLVYLLLFLGKQTKREPILFSTLVNCWRARVCDFSYKVPSIITFSFWFASSFSYGFLSSE